MELERWTPLTFVAPGRYVSDDDRWAEFDLEAWSDDEYRWIEDPWNGFRDFARRPAETVAAGRGDCEDYALVALAWAAAHGRDGLGLAFCFAPPYPWPTHVVAYDEDRVYSSGEVFDGTVSEWVEGSDYRFALRRRVR